MYTITDSDDRSIVMFLVPTGTTLVAVCLVAVLLTLLVGVQGADVSRFMEPEEIMAQEFLTGRSLAQPRTLDLFVHLYRFFKKLLLGNEY